jgi:hypothetical protein
MELLFHEKQHGRFYEVKKNGTPLYLCKYDLHQEKKTVTDIAGRLLGFGIHIQPTKGFTLKTNNYLLKIGSLETKLTRSGFPESKMCCEYKESKYCAIIHWGRKVSLIKNEVQIGYFIKEGNPFKGDIWNMKLLANSNEEDVFLILWCLHVYSNFIRESPDGSNPAFSISFSKTQFNKSWVPQI